MNIVIAPDWQLELVADEYGLAAISGWPVASWADEVDALDRLVLVGLADVLARNTDIDGTHGCDRRVLVERVATSAEHRWVVERWLEDLADAGMVDVVDDGRVRLVERPRRQDLTAARKRMIDACVRVGYSTSLPTLLLDSLRYAVDLLRGTVSVQSILYPDGDATTALEVYGTNVVSRYLNAAAAAVVADLACTRAAPLRILELGAGVGATSEHILGALGDARVERYVFTDLSPHFLRIARTRFAREPWAQAMTFVTVDITEPVADQVGGGGPDGVSYDVVLAATMAHNAVDVDVLLREVHDLLAPGGVVVLIETVVEHAQSLTTMPFALSMPDGSGPPERTDIRAGSHRTYLTSDEWTAAMTSAGLRPCVDLPRAGDPLEAFSQRLLVAVRPDPLQPPRRRQ
ncbi:class I SAM-dependent methyltransferase [Rhodococcus sp. H29-C3]|uniref:class I SAM-dependent methyltransferase n=1 Tax=Rhodococcus sp. H29-C3 TaxID=3046307 RepID=UPI0024BA3FCF|nr:class I SAM-dependent methyltransferase [Rhodococcus sp. H29-C3]MDJ0363089.1 class I SAM-dependent methyltransferase [Rhodococcus sp. H29-C3]